MNTDTLKIKNVVLSKVREGVKEGRPWKMATFVQPDQGYTRFTLFVGSKAIFQGIEGDVGVLEVSIGEGSKGDAAVYLESFAPYQK